MIELLIVVAILGAMVALSVNSFSRAKHIAALGSSQATLRQARTALELGLVQVVEELGGVTISDEVITEQSQISNSNLLRELLWGFQLPTRISLLLSVDSNCLGSDCIQSSITVDHENACKVVQNTQFGDGQDITITIPKPDGC